MVGCFGVELCLVLLLRADGVCEVWKVGEWVEA